MKLKNVKIGDLLYLKTPSEVKASTYYLCHRGDVINFIDGTTYYDKNDAMSAGQLVRVEQIFTPGDIQYTGNGGYVSRHAFRKPTKKELAEYNGGVNYED